MMMRVTMRMPIERSSLAGRRHDRSLRRLVQQRQWMMYHPQQIQMCQLL